MWDTVGFKLWVTEEKLVRVEMLLEEFWKKRREIVGVREIARVAGVIGSFTLAMGNVGRFYTRGMLTQVAEMLERAGWQCMVGWRGECWMRFRFGSRISGV